MEQKQTRSRQGRFLSYKSVFFSLNRGINTSPRLSWHLIICCFIWRFLTIKASPVA